MARFNSSKVQWENDNQLIALDSERVNGENLGDPVGHDLLELLAGYRLEPA